MDEPSEDASPVGDAVKGAMPRSDWPTSNPDVRLHDVEVLSNNWYVLRKATFDYRDRGGNWTTQEREAYDRGDGVTLLLVNREHRTVILTRQFRVPAISERPPRRDADRSSGRPERWRRPGIRHPPRSRRRDRLSSRRDHRAV